MGKVIGQGKDSIVYICDDKKHVIKESKRKGIRNSLELFIKMNLNEKELMTSDQFNIDEDNKVNIIEKKGIDVIRHIRNKSFEKRKEICKNICIGVFHLHKYGILHGDIKPANILIYNKMVKLNDFSCSKILLKEIKLKNNCYTQLYKSNDKYLSLKSDIYALGCTIYEILTGGDKLYQEIGTCKIKCFQKLEDETLNKMISLMIKENEEERPDIRKILHLFDVDLKEKIECKNIQNILEDYCKERDIDINEMLDNINYNIPLKNERIIEKLREDNFNFLLRISHKSIREPKNYKKERK